MPYIVVGLDTTPGAHQGKERFYIAPGQTHSSHLPMLTLSRADAWRLEDRVLAEVVLAAAQVTFPPATDWRIQEA